MDPCFICGDTNGDCACSLPDKARTPGPLYCHPALSNQRRGGLYYVTDQEDGEGIVIASGLTQGDAQHLCRCWHALQGESAGIEFDFADHMICDQIKDKMVSLLKHINYAEFIIAIHEIIKQATKEVDKDA